MHKLELLALHRGRASMSTGEASGRDAFDFLSNISFGGPESGSRSSKKSKTSQSRSVVSHKAGELTKSARGGPGEGGEGHLKNSRPSAHPTDDSPSKSSLNASHKASETVPTPVKIRSSHSGSTHHKETKESKYALPLPYSGYISEAKNERTSLEKLLTLL